MRTKLKEREFRSSGALIPFLQQIFGYALEYRTWFTRFVAAAVMVAILDAIFPLIWLNYIDHQVTPLVERYRDIVAAGTAVDLDLSGLYQFGLIYLAVMTLQVLGIGTFIYHAGLIEEHVIFDLRRDMFNKLQMLSFAYYDRAAIGWLISRITSDTDRVTELISWGFLSLVWGLIMIVACFVAMLFYSWQLTLMVLVTIPLLVLITMKLRMLILTYARESRKINSEMTAMFNEHVHGIEVNKVTGQEAKAAGGFSRVSQRMRQASFKAAYYSAMFMPLVVMVGSIAAALVIYMGGNLALAAQGITIGVLAAFFGYATMIFEPILDITRFYALAQSALSAGERIFSLIQEKPQIVDAPGTPDFGAIRGKIEFENVRFHYVPEKPVIPGLNLVIEPGQSIALVGPTGEGKSTIASLIGRFYQPVSGAVRIDGIDYRTRTQRSFRRQLGVILQTPHVFSGTIIENIRYGDHDAPEAKIIATLELIGAQEMIGRLHEPVGEEGSTLSSGEKQLISFARVILKDPRILIMDEATSSVDTLAEARIQRGIEQLIQGRTAIIIAHRLSTIKHCDRILVIRKGAILEDGSHEELLARKGFYYSLYTRQVREMVA